jgi:hypothetical protein
MRLHSFERRYNHDYNTSHLYYDDDVDVRYDVSCYGSLCSETVLISVSLRGA